MYPSFHTLIKLVSNTLKRIIKKIAHNFGVEITHYVPSNSAAAQLNKALFIAKIDIVFDIGANKGQFGKMIGQSGYKNLIVSFEPLSSARVELLDYSKKDFNWIIHEQCAIGDHDGTIEINISGNSVSSSVL